MRIGSRREARQAASSAEESRVELQACNVPELRDDGLSLKGVSLSGRDKLGGGTRVVDGGVGILEIRNDLSFRLLDVGGGDLELVDERHVGYWQGTGAGCVTEGRTDQTDRSLPRCRLPSPASLAHSL